MKMVCDMRPQIQTLSISLAGFACCAFLASAAEGPYDLDLKELRPTPARRVKEQRPLRNPKESVLAPPGAQAGSSIYVVRPGDHLFLILMKRYGLSNKAAEQLIPEIMRVNGIRKPEGLVVGQRLTIPLPATDTARNTALQDKRLEARHSPLSESADMQPRATTAHHEREVVAFPSKPCLLAREVAEQLGVRSPTLSPFLDNESVSVSNGGRKMAVVCGVEPAVTYTLERLLAVQGINLLVFKVDEDPRTVVEGLAGGLNILFRLSNADTVAELPLTYLFPAAIDGKDLELTIRPEAAASK